MWAVIYYLNKFSKKDDCSGGIFLERFFLLLKISILFRRISSEGTKLKFREVEKVALKIYLLNSHLSFNETCSYIYVYKEMDRKMHIPFFALHR